MSYEAKMGMREKNNLEQKGIFLFQVGGTWGKFGEMIEQGHCLKET